MLRLDTRKSLATLLLVCLLHGQANSEEWPTHQFDVRRSGYSPEKLIVNELELVWSWRSPSPWNTRMTRRVGC